MTNRLVELPSEGRLLVVTDLHGNFEDYQRYIDLWDSNNPDFHIVFVGDYIHAYLYEDNSIEILDDLIEKSKKYDNFHLLLGNHELTRILGKTLYKGHSNQTKDFEELIISKKGSLQPYLSNYINFFRSLPFFVRTDNKIFISHAGPIKAINSAL